MSQQIKSAGDKQVFRWLVATPIIVSVIADAVRFISKQQVHLLSIALQIAGCVITYLLLKAYYTNPRYQESIGVMLVAILLGYGLVFYSCFL